MQEPNSTQQSETPATGEIVAPTTEVPAVPAVVEPVVAAVVPPAAAEKKETAAPTSGTNQPVTINLPAVKLSEMKIVITYKDNRALVGISKTDADPVFFIATGNLDSVLNMIQSYVQDAREKWQTAQRYPKAVVPAAPPAAPSTSRPVTTASRSVATPAAPKKDDVKPRML